PPLGRELSSKRTDPPGELLGRRRITQVHAGELEAAAHEVRVIIGEAGDDEPPVEIDDLRLPASHAFGGGRAADQDHAAIPDGDGLGNRIAGDTGPDAAAGQYEVGITGG